MADTPRRNAKTTDGQLALEILTALLAADIIAESGEAEMIYRRMPEGQYPIDLTKPQALLIQRILGGWWD